jgi:hypothetical protein
LNTDLTDGTDWGRIKNNFLQIRPNPPNPLNPRSKNRNDNVSPPHADPKNLFGSVPSAQSAQSVFKNRNDMPPTPRGSKKISSDPFYPSDPLNPCSKNRNDGGR